MAHITGYTISVKTKEAAEAVAEYVRTNEVVTCYEVGIMKMGDAYFCSVNLYFNDKDMEQALKDLVEDILTFGLEGHNEG